MFDRIISGVKKHVGVLYMYQVIVNPSARSGFGRRNWNRIKKVLDSREIPYAVHFTQKSGDAAKYAKLLYEEFSERDELLNLIVLGGDGTLNEVVQGLPAFDNLALSCIPVGSSNDLARAIGISFVPEEAVDHLLTKPTTLYMDCGTVAFTDNSSKEQVSRRFLVSTGFGYDASICHEANASSLKKALNKFGMGKLVYLAICLKQLISTKSCAGKLYLNNSDEAITLSSLLLIAGMNNKYEGGGFKFAPDASNHDGLIDLCTVSGLSKTKILRILPTCMKGEHTKFNGITIHRASHYKVVTDVPLHIHTDGESIYTSSEIDVSCEKEIIRLVF